MRETIAAPSPIPLIDLPNRRTRARIIPWASVVVASLTTIVPVAATLPLLPPFGLLMLLAWRLLAPLSLRIWAPAMLGLFDDVVSGQPLGSAMLFWQAGFFVIALLDRRTMFRGFREDWLIAAGIIAVALIGGRLVASPLRAPVDGVLLCQVMISILLFPFAAKAVAWIDRKREVAA